MKLMDTRVKFLIRDTFLAIATLPQCIGFGAIKSIKSKSNRTNLRILIGFLNLGKGSDFIWIWSKMSSKSNQFQIKIQIIRSNLASGHQRSDFADALRSAVISPYLSCLIDGPWYGTAGTALRDLFHFEVLSGNSVWRLTFLNKTKLPGENGYNATTSSAPWIHSAEGWRIAELLIRTISPRFFKKSVTMLHFQIKQQNKTDLEKPFQSYSS